MLSYFDIFAPNPNPSTPPPSDGVGGGLTKISIFSTVHEMSDI